VSLHEPWLVIPFYCYRFGTESHRGLHGIHYGHAVVGSDYPPLERRRRSVIYARFDSQRRRLRGRTRERRFDRQPCRV